jgi:hypothetical protein
MFEDLRNKLIDFLKVEEVIEEEPEPIIKLGDVWKTKPDGWVGVVQEINEYVITSYNLKENKINITMRKYCKYDFKTKIIDYENSRDPITRMNDAIDRKYAFKTLSLYELTNNLIKTDDNFIEIDALLGE